MSAATDSPPASPSKAQAEPARGAIRGVCESLLSLLIAVILVRSLLVEGYLITTGSMAPHFFGQHKRVVCPACGIKFTVGTEFDEQSTGGVPEWSQCPNCLRDDIDLHALPKNRGDHLLVWKNAFQFRDPNRWEVIVFRNPNSPLETFLKRAVGLPGEAIQVEAGNVWIDGKLARKPLDVQQTLALLVFDQSYPPADDPEWSPRWSPSRSDSNWSRSGTTWNFVPNQDGADRLEYRHTWRSGGDHETRIRLTEPLSAAQQRAFELRDETFPFTPEPPFPGVRYDKNSNSLSARGVVTDRVHLDLLKVDQSDSFSLGIAKLYEKSRFGPVLDVEAYNAYSRAQAEFPITEFLLSCNIHPHSREGAVVLTLATPEEEFLLTLDFAAAKVTLTERGSTRVLREGSFSWKDDDTVAVVFSTIDRQICVAINDEEPFSAWELSETLNSDKMPEVITSFDQATVALDVSNLKLFRDVYYTPGQAHHGVDSPYQLAEDQFFVLGDNSPVSSDSRNWFQPAVGRKLIVGKPFVVHLPSEAAKIRWGEKEIRFRVPDFSRMRFVR